MPWPEKPAALAAAEEELLQRLVALNAERAAEEARGEVRWLRPEFQDPARRAASASAALPTPVQEEIEQEEIEQEEQPETSAKTSTKTSTTTKPKAGRKAPVASLRHPWPATLPEQVRAVADALAAAPGALGEALLAEAFTGRGPWKKRLPGILLTLEALGRARREGARWRA